MNKKLFSSENSLYFSRELSWLAFNDRVLEEAADPSTPIFERLKFLTIVSSNLEEFFMVRIARLNRLVENQSGEPVKPRDEFDVNKLLDRIRQWVVEQKTRQSDIYKDVKAGLAQAGLVIEEGPSPLAKEILEARVLPHLKIQSFKNTDKLPHLAGSKLHILAKHGKHYSLVEMPVQVPRIIIVKSKHVFLADRLIFSYPEIVFPGQEVDEIFSFKISRDAALEWDEEGDDPAQEIEEALKERDSGSIVRVEFDSPESSAGVQWLKNQIGKPDSRKLYTFNLPLDLKAFFQIYNIKKFKKNKATYPEPLRPKALPAGLSVQKFFAVLDKKDILLHHPYSAFEPVVEFVRNAAMDPKVTRICQTLYRTSGNSPLIDALMLAAKSGKKVTVMVEIKARFDEANNVRMARALKKAGASVIYGSPSFKVHSKLTFVEKKVGAKTKRYAHISTGNYHPKTARIYTDLGVLTSNPEICTDAKVFFDLMEEMEASGDHSLLEDSKKFAEQFKCFLVSPQSLFDRIVEFIEREIHHKNHGRAAHIFAKMNGLVEHKMIDVLYRASQAGVKIDLLIRGVCCIRPGVKGLSENIRVHSIVDKYLEHSRLFMFHNGGDEEVYISSADWMPRNFFRRVEVAMPIKNPEMRKYLRETFWNTSFDDDVKTRVCNSKGIYERVAHFDSNTKRAQLAFEKMDIPEFSTKVVSEDKQPVESKKHQKAD